MHPLQLPAGLASCHFCATYVDLYVGAGYDTTVIGLSWTIYHLASRPAIQAQIIAEVDAFGQQQPGIDDMAAFPFTEACFREAMRLNPLVNPLLPQACNMLLPRLCTCCSIRPPWTCTACFAGSEHAVAACTAADYAAATELA